MNKTIVKKMPVAQKIMSQTQRRLPNYRTLAIALISVFIVVSVASLFAFGVWKLPGVNPLIPIVTVTVAPTPTSTPTVTVAPTPTSVPTVTVAPTPVIPDGILIFEPEYWKTAVFPIDKSDGSRIPGINFIVPKGTKIYAPYDGTIGILGASYEKDGETINTLLVSIVRGDWDPMGQFGPGTYRLDFMTNDFQRVNGLGSGTKVKKGQLIGVTGSEELIFPDQDKNAGNFSIGPVGSWEEDRNLSVIDNTVDYLKKMFDMVN